MGIRFLQTFLCNEVPDGYFKVDIGREIHKWKKENSGPAVIVFDVMGMLNIPIQSNSDMVLGGRHHIVLSKYDNFFLKLKLEYGAELVFFCDGRVQKNKNDVWIQRQDEKYAKTLKIFDEIEESKGSLKFVDSMRDDDFPGLTTTIHGLVNVCRRHGEFKLSMNVECDTELSRFATMNNAVAIVADDTDFLIYEGNWKYWSARKLNLLHLTTMEYCRPALRMALGLSQKQLPMFATLAGNDIIRHDFVQPFHRQLRLTRYNRFQKLAQLVRSNNINDVASISRAIFGSTESQFMNLVEESITTYDIYYDHEQGTQEDLLTERSAFETSFFTFLNGSSYYITLMYYDLRRTDFRSYYDVVMPIVKRQIGFVRHHKNEQNYMQTIVMKIDHTQSHQELKIAPEYPKIQLPDLMELTFNTQNESLTTVRFDVLAWIVFGCQEIIQIEQIAPKYMVVVSALKFLLSINEITPTEADAVLLCVHEIHQKTVPLDISRGKVSTRSIVVSHLYSRIHNTILICFKFVGLEKFIDYLVFDGPYFIFLLKSLLSKSEEDYNDAVAGIQEQRKFLLH
ncbi:Constitutive coactivator of peroxisome proliferator-activated receptor gamma [Pseudolycoriella hygida]|uniref:Constitutive coactivator of peroxisome proliferator-activated receptor gamma n=1 Tax=Pseudolycoriella hygida TaxID=35572 RepID=A0A9Q0N525_9DIPT|nr:Constitutive coactivator of peroxisome proliferator-activated receptor gamma [Pseudolycoriella hygida]